MWRVSFLALAAAACAAQRPAWRYPAEWEPHAALWVGFRTAESGAQYDGVMIPALQALAPRVPIKLVVESEAYAAEARAVLEKHGVDLSRVELFVQAPTDFFYRDPGPIFLVGADGRLAVADFKYSNYSNVPPEKWTEKARRHDGIDRDVAARLGLSTVTSRVVMEGGAFEVNGAGTVVLVEPLMFGRNPHLTREEIEREVMATLGQRKVLWVPEGPADDPSNFARIDGEYVGFGTGGHSDEFIRFADARTILLAWVAEEDARDPVSRRTRANMLEVERRLKAATDQDGRPFRIVRVPHPDLEWEERTIDPELAKYVSATTDVREGEKVRYVAVASYLNYVVTNGVLLLPRYWREGRPDSLRRKDDEARRIFEQSFPGRVIVPIDVLALNYGAGGLHCVVQQQPSAGPTGR